MEINWTEVLTPIMQALAVIIGGFLVEVLRRLAAKYGLEVSEAKKAALEKAAIAAVLAVEERAAAALKAKVMPSAMKRASAAELIKATMPSASDADVESAIDAALPVVGIGASAPGKPRPVAS